MKKCPYCAEEIQDEAKKCKHCSEWLSENDKANDCASNNSNIVQEESMWTRFKGKENTNDVLVEKAKAISTVIITLGAENARSLFHVLTIDNDEKKGDVFLEMVLFSLHVIDRSAFQYLSAEQRSVFVDALFLETRGLLSRIHENATDAAQFHSAFDLAYNERQMEYANYEKMFAGGEEGCAGTLFWEFSGKITGIVSFKEDILVRDAVLKVAASSLDILQLPELFGEHA